MHLQIHSVYKSMANWHLLDSTDIGNNTYNISNSY